MKKLTVVFILFLLVFARQSFAQKRGQALIDSLLTQLPKLKDDTIKVDVLKVISFNYYLSAPDTGLQYGNQALNLAEKLKWKKGIADSYNSIASNYYAKADYNAALEAYARASEIYEAIGRKNEAAKVLVNSASVYVLQSNYPKALDNYLQALRLAEQQGNKKAMAAIAGNMGALYSDLGEKQKALKNYEKALKLHIELGDDHGMALTSVNIGNIYFDKGNYKVALDNYFRALKISEEKNYKSIVATVNGSIGNTYLFLNDYNKGQEYNFKSLQLARELGDAHEMASGFGNFGSLYLHIAKDSSKTGLNKLFAGNRTAALQKAKIYTDSAITILKKIGDLYKLSANYLLSSEIETLLGNNITALESYKNYSILNDSIFNIEKDKKLTQTAMQYEFDKKEAAVKAEQEKKDIRQRNVRNSISVGLAAALIFSLVVYRQRNRIAKEKKRSEELLLNILPEEVAEELKEKGEAEAKLIEEVTVLFTDFKGFTALSETLSPKELVRDLHECFTAFDQIIEKHGLEKIKTIGDAYMAAGGLPTPNTTHPADVVAAALEIREFIEAGKARKIANREPYFEIRIGVNTGPVVAGIVGVKKFSYDIWGDTVNTASRMESSGEVGKVNISGSTYELVKDKFSCTHRGKITAKGKGEIDMYFAERTLA